MQLINPNFTIKEVAGRCLQYSETVFGHPGVGDTAWDEWNNTKLKHRDRNFPSGVAFPVWFDWSGNIKWSDGVIRWGRYGHVAVMAGDGTIYSSPLSGVGRATFPSVDALTRAFGNGMTYVGWSEDIANVKVIEGEDMSKTGLNEERILSFGIAGRNGTFGTINSLGGGVDGDLNSNHVGTETNASIATWYNSEEGRYWREARLPYLSSRAALADTLEQTVSQLNDQILQLKDNPSAADVKQLKDALDAANAQAAEAQKAAADEAAKLGELQKQADADKSAGDSFIRRVGQFIAKYLPGNK